jgi:hypothetical protein
MSDRQVEIVLVLYRIASHCFLCLGRSIQFPIPSRVNLIAYWGVVLHKACSASIVVAECVNFFFLSLIRYIEQKFVLRLRLRSGCEVTNCPPKPNIMSKIESVNIQCETENHHICHVKIRLILDMTRKNSATLLLHEGEGNCEPENPHILMDSWCVIFLSSALPILV